MKILFLDENHPVLHETLVSKGFHCDLLYNLSENEIEKALPLYDGIVLRSKIKLTAHLIDKAPKLKFIARVGSGMENIDTLYAESKNIKCIHAPEGNCDAVAEHALAMLLALLNKINTADAEVRKGVWIREANRGDELMGKTVAVIGYGNTGKAFVRRLSGFGVKILVYDKYVSNFSDSFVTETNWNTIFELADVLSLHIPLTPETHHLVNADLINRFKKNFYLINTSRGQCINTRDVVEALKSGKIKGACLDVLEYESVSFEKLQLDQWPAPFKELTQMRQVVLTPHIAGWSIQSKERLAKIIAQKILDFTQMLSNAD